MVFCPSFNGRYKITVHTPCSFSFEPGIWVNETGVYQPSREIQYKINEMRQSRTSSLIGAITEAIAAEILVEARVTVDNERCLIRPEKLRKFFGVSSIWNPQHGIYSDDLIAIATKGESTFLFPTEVKGTMLQKGFSHSTEAKMIYQLARTCHTLVQNMPGSLTFRLAGGITIEISHFLEEITLNVFDTKGILGFFPDGWLPNGRW